MHVLSVNCSTIVSFACKDSKEIKFCFSGCQTHLIVDLSLILCIHVLVTRLSPLHHVMTTYLCCPPLSRKRGDIKSHSSVRPSLCLSVCLSVCPSVRHKNFNLGYNFCTITDRALIPGMCVLCDKTFPMVPCRDLDHDLWPTSRLILLPSGGPQFSEFAC